MARIPIAEPRVTPSAQAPVARSLAAERRRPQPIASKEGLWKEAANLAERTTQIGFRMIEARNAREAAKAEAMATEAYLNLEKEFQSPEFAQANKFSTYENLHKERAKTITNDILDQLDVTPNARRQIKGALDESELSSRSKIIAFAHAAEIDQWASEIPLKLQRDLNIGIEAGISTDDILMNKTLSNVEGYLAGMRKAGVITPTQEAQYMTVFQNSLQRAVIEKQIETNPGDVIEQLAKPVKDKDGNFLIDEDVRLKYLDKAKEHVAELTKLKVTEADRKEKRDAAERKKEIADNDMQAWLDFYKPKPERITTMELRRRANNRDISEETYKAINEKLISGTIDRDDPEVVADIATDLEHGLDVTNKLKIAKDNGEISDKTFITMSRNMADEEYKRGLSIVNAAMKPTGITMKYQPDRYLRYTDALQSFHRRIRGGMKPEDAAILTVEGHFREVDRSISTMPYPIFYPPNVSQKDDLGALETAQQATIDAHENDKLSDAEYREQIILIMRLRRAANSKPQSTEGTAERGEARKRRNPDIYLRAAEPEENQGD